MNPGGQYFAPPEIFKRGTSSNASKNQRRVGATKTKRVVHDCTQLAFLSVMRNEIQPVSFLNGLIQVDGGRDNAGQQRFDAEHGLKGPRRAQQVSGHGFGTGYS